MPRRRRLNPGSETPPPKLYLQKNSAAAVAAAADKSQDSNVNLKRSTWKHDSTTTSPSVSPPAKKIDARNGDNVVQHVPSRNAALAAVSKDVSNPNIQTAKKTITATPLGAARASNAPAGTGSPKKKLPVTRLNERDYACLESKANVILKDLAKGKENFAVRLVNDIDDEKVPQFKYISCREISEELQPFVDRDQEFGEVRCCTVDTCGQHCAEGTCPCRAHAGNKITYKNFLLMYNELELYNNAIHVIKECNYSCYCHNVKNKTKKGQIACYNRVFSKGSKIPLDVFRTENRGWGVRPRVPVAEGAYIGEYVGVLKKDSPAESGGGDYIHGLGETIGPEVKSAVDACEKGNFTRFINHSCDPNLFVAKVSYESINPGLLHLCLFTLRPIPAFEEILIDYGHSFWDAKQTAGMFCLCGSPECHHPPPTDSDVDETIPTRRAIPVLVTPMVSRPRPKTHRSAVPMLADWVTISELFYGK